MPYFPRMPPPRPYSFDGFFEGYDDYGFYGGSFYGPPPRPHMGFRGGLWRGRGRGGGPAGPAPKAAGAATSPAPAAAPPAKAEPSAAPAGAKVPAVEKPSAQPAPNGVVPATTAQPAATQPSTKPAPQPTAQPVALPAAASAPTSNDTVAATGVKRKVDEILSDDHPFPSSVTEKFFPNRCDLCSAVFPVARDIFIPEKGGMEYMESNLQSTMHYNGKSHKKRLRQFMQDYCRKHRLVTPRRARELMKDTPAMPRSDQEDAAKVDLYCKACDLSFTSVQHASQHYAGKSHQRKLEGKPPLKTGYYNARLGRWQRLPVEEQQPIGPYPPRPFVPVRPADGPAKPSLAAALADPTVVTVQVAPGNLVNAGGKLPPSVAVSAASASAAPATATATQSKFYCSICNVSATCQLQLDTHINGSKHKLQAKKMGLPEPPGQSVAGGGGTAEPAPKRPLKDYSIYKTPSGKFYCLPCDLTMNSEIQFAQHFESKKHKAEVAKQRSTVGSAY